MDPKITVSEGWKTPVEDEADNGVEQIEKTILMRKTKKHCRFRVYGRDESTQNKNSLEKLARHAVRAELRAERLIKRLEKRQDKERAREHDEKNMILTDNK